MSDSNLDYIPRNYEDWKFCITKKCGIPLTKDYIEKRLAAFRDLNSDHTKKFIEIYGEQYTNQIISWFVLAQDEFKK